MKYYNGWILDLLLCTLLEINWNKTKTSIDPRVKDGEGEREMEREHYSSSRTQKALLNNHYTKSITQKALHKKHYTKLGKPITFLDSGESKKEVSKIKRNEK